MERAAWGKQAGTAVACEAGVLPLRVLMVTNVYPTPERPGSGVAVQVQERGLRALGVDLDLLLLPRAERGALAYCGAGRRMREAFARHRADLVHVQFGGVQAAQAVRTLGRRVVITFHGTDVHGGVPKGAGEALRYRLGVWCSRWAAQRAGWSIAVSEHLARSLRAVAPRVSAIPTGVDYERFAPRPREECVRRLGLDPDRAYVLFSDANRDAVKRPDLACAAVREARARHPEIEMLELHDVPGERVPLYLNAASCLLVTSDKEGSPNIVKEAIACNTPIVSVDVGDVAMRIAGIRNCVLAPRDVPAIAGALADVVAAGERADGREGSRPSIENGEVCRQVVEVYRKVLDDARLSSPPLCRPASGGAR